MKRLLKKKADPPQQPPPIVQKSPPPPPPLFSRFASSSQSTGSISSPRVISGPAPLAPRDSLHRQGGPHDGSPPKPSSPRVVSAPMQRNRTYEKQQPMNGKGEDKPLPDLEQPPPQKVNSFTFRREPGQSLQSRAPPMTADDPPPKPPKSIPESRKHEDLPKNAEPASVSPDFSPIPKKPRGRTNKLNRAPASSSPERKPSSASAPSLTLQNPPDRPQPRRKYSPLEAFGYVPGEDSPVPSTTASSVNLLSQNSTSEPVPPSVSTTSTDSLPSHPREAPVTPDLDATPRKNRDPRRESLPVRVTGIDGPPAVQNSEKLEHPQTADSSNEYQDLKTRADQPNRTRAHHPLGPRSSINRGPVQGQPRIFASMNTGTDFQQEPLILKQGQPRIFASNGQDSNPRSTNEPQLTPGYGRGTQPQQDPPTLYNPWAGYTKGKGVDLSGVDSMPGHHQQPERQVDQRDNQVSPRGQTAEAPIRTVYTRAKSPAVQYRESLEKDWNHVGGNDRPDSGSAEPRSQPPSTPRLPVRRNTEPHFEPPSPAPLRKDSSGSSNGPQQRFMGPRGQLTDHQQALNLNGDDATSKINRRPSLYSPAVSITTSIEGSEFSGDLPIPSPRTSPKSSPKTARSFGQRSGTVQREPGRYQSPPTPSSFNTESGPPTTNGYPSPVVNDSSPELVQSRDSRGQPFGWNVQNSTPSLSTQDSSRKASFTSNASASSDRERDRGPAVAEPQPTRDRTHKSTKSRRSDNIQAPPPSAHHRPRERFGTGTTPTNRGSQMDSFYGGEASLSGMRKPGVGDVEEEGHPYPLELHLLHPQLLRALLQCLSFYDWCVLYGVNKSLRSQLGHVRELKEEVLERYLSTIGYARWVWEEDEPLAITLRDLNEYMRGVSLPTHEYARISDNYLQARVSAATKEERMIHTDQARAMSFATRAYSRIVLRLRAQAEAVMAHGGAISKISPGPATGSYANIRGVVSTGTSRPPSPSSYGRQHSRPPNGQRGRMVFASPIYQPRRAPLLRVFVPSPEEWLSDASVVECESELDRAGILHMLRPGDAVWDIAVGDEGNAGRMIWDGNFLLDLDYNYSAPGDLPKYLPSMAFAPSYFHKVIRINGNPVVRVDLNPWSEEIAMNLQLLQDRVKTETSQGTYHNVVRWVHRSSFQIYPPSNGKRIPLQLGSTTWYIDSGWYGTIVVEAEGTNEGLADLQSRCHSAFPSRNESEGQGSRDEERRRVFRILRERSKPGEIWIRTVGDKERLIP